MDQQHYPRRTTSSDKASGGLFASPIPFALALLGAGSTIFSLWYFFYAGGNRSANEPIPIIKAEAGPIKVRPDSGDQPEVPHQDKLVYSRVNPAEQSSGVEKLLPPTEEPVDVAELEIAEEMPAEKTKDAGFPTPHQVAENASEFRLENQTDSKSDGPMIMTASQDTDASKSALAESKPAAVVPEEIQKVEIVTEPLAPFKKAPAPALQSGFRIQLASMKSQDMAKQEWARLQTEHNTVLKNLPAKFTRVDLGAKKGVFYRLQVGDFADRAEAQNVCNQLLEKNPKAGCIIVKF